MQENERDTEKRGEERNKERREKERANKADVGKNGCTTNCASLSFERTNRIFNSIRTFFSLTTSDSSVYTINLLNKPNQLNENFFLLNLII